MGKPHGFLWAWAAAALLAPPAACLCPAGGAADEPPETQAPPAGRFNYAHRIALYDAEGNKISLGDDPLLPFATRTTCGRCHEYEQVGSGWHFNAADPAAPAGRPGEPWILTHAGTGTQLPLSYRRWEGTWRPGDVGLTAWGFVQTFGRHMPGGGAGWPLRGEPPAGGPADPKARWAVSGKLEVNCLACHSADRGDDMNQWFVEIARGNLMWAPAGMSALATVRGSAAAMPETYDPFMEPDSDDPASSAPQVAYDKSQFDPAGRVFFDVVRRAPPARCYFCHSDHAVGPGAAPKWQRDQDVHLAAGLTCTDCHRNGLDHAIVRGDEVATPPAPAETLSCRGCHLGVPTYVGKGGFSPGGRLGAPVPRHPGLPGVHLDKLACTACHAGPWPQSPAGRVQTSRAHALEFHGGHRGDDALPVILSPVYARGADGKIAPHKLLWPAFWGRLRGGAVAPVAPEAVAEAAKAVFRDKQLQGRRLTAAAVAAALEALAERPDADGGEWVYVCGGKLYRRGDDGRLDASDHPAARPYAWPMGHDVRPAARSLGSDQRCTDCHAAGAAFLFGQVPAEGPARIGTPATRPMHEFQGLDPTYEWCFAASFAFRPWLKLTGFASAGVIAAVLARYGFLALGGLLKVLSGRKD